MAMNSEMKIIPLRSPVEVSGGVVRGSEGRGASSRGGEVKAWFFTVKRCEKARFWLEKWEF
jgi:hypothetical protein